MNHFNLLMILQTLADFFEGYFLQQLYGSFFDGRFRNKYWNGVSAAGSYVLFQYLKKLILSADYRVFQLTENLVLTFFALFFLAICFYKNIGIISVFLIVCFMAVQETSRIITLLFPYIADLLTGLLRQYAGSKITTDENYLFLFTMLIADGVWILAYVVRMVIMYVSLKSIREGFCEKRFRIHPAEVQFLLIPGFTSLGISILVNLMLFRVGEGGEQEFLFDLYPALRFFMPGMLMLSLLSILYGVRLFQDMLLLNRERSSRAVLEKQLRSMQEYMEETERIQSGIRSMRHDMKNTLAVIAQLALGSLEEGNGELSRYLSGLNQTMSSLEYKFRTGNMVVDALLNMKYHEAVSIMPDLQLDAEELLFPEDLKVQSYDMGVIIGNALDNAVDACKKVREEKPGEAVYIRLSSFERRKMFFLEVENTFNGRLVRKKRWELPVSDKEDGEVHGLGLINIKNAAEKYHGAMEWEVRGRVFVLSVMLKNEREGV